MYMYLLVNGQQCLEVVAQPKALACAVYLGNLARSAKSNYEPVF